MYEIITLIPLFPGKNELAQIQKIHTVLGTPDAQLLERFKKLATHMEFNFPQHEGTGIAKLLKNVSPECLDLIEKMLIYNPDERLTAKQCLKHPFFKELRELEKRESLAQTTNAHLSANNVLNYSIRNSVYT
jgi:renal tumor antigen